MNDTTKKYNKHTNTNKKIANANSANKELLMLMKK